MLLLTKERDVEMLKTLIKSLFCLSILLTAATTGVYAETEQNNACLADQSCGEAILAAFVVEDYKAAITETKFYNVNNEEVLSVQMSYEKDKFKEKVSLPIGKYHIKTSVIGVDANIHQEKKDDLFTFDIFGDVEVKEDETASFRTFVGNEDLMYKYGWIVNFPFANKPEDYGGVYDLNMLKTLENKYVNEVLGKPMKEKYKQEIKEEQKMIEAEKETNESKYSSFVKFVFIPVVVVGILYVGFREADRLKRIIRKD
jgi:hypothetical protein